MGRASDSDEGEDGKASKKIKLDPELEETIPTSSSKSENESMIKQKKKSRRAHVCQS